MPVGNDPEAVYVPEIPPAKLNEKEPDTMPPGPVVSSPQPAIKPSDARSASRRRCIGHLMSKSEAT